MHTAAPNAAVCMGSCMCSGNVGVMHHLKCMHLNWTERNTLLHNKMQLHVENYLNNNLSMDSEDILLTMSCRSPW